MGCVHSRRIGVSRRANASGGDADLFKESVLASNSLDRDIATKARTFLLNQMFDITLVLLDKRGRDLHTHWCTPLR